MQYISTRNENSVSSFSDVVFSGLARDGGLYIPKTLPDFSNELEQFHVLTYLQKAEKILTPFVEECFSKKDLSQLITRSYQNFRDPSVVTLKHLEKNSLLELHHGPTLAFKDIALQLLGNIFETLLPERKQRLNLIGATSGDTGSAAIYGVRGKENINIFMLHPRNRISKIQELQMTSILDSNVYNLAVDGNFDDCQAIVKALFNDHEFRDALGLGAVNSINWARIMAQIVYYFEAYCLFSKKFPGAPLRFCVPTGNFGNVYAGYIAQKMGLPVEKFIVATNDNDIVGNCIETGKYKIGNVVPTISPSMDVQISSNFERFIFDVVSKNGEKVSQKMKNLKETGEFSLDQQELSFVQKYFCGIKISEETTRSCLERTFKNDKFIIDPHTAVAYAAAEEFSKQEKGRVICLSTAHPAKFHEVIDQTLHLKYKLPEQIALLYEKKQRRFDIDNNLDKIKKFITQHQ